MRQMFAFDLDGTVTSREALPLLAEEVGLSEEMGILTRMAMDGAISFEQSFRLRFHILRGIPIPRAQEIMAGLPLDPFIEGFIREHGEYCAIVTANLDVWIRPVIERLGCICISSESGRDDDGGLTLRRILNKGEALRELRREAERIVAIGDGANDIPMFEEADVAIAYGGVHTPAPAVAAAADCVVSDGEELCRLLRREMEYAGK